MIHRNVLRYAGGRYFWWSMALLAASIALFATQTDYYGWNGGTWQGYVLGTLAAVLIVWLTLLGIRKRSYRSGIGSVQGWTSAHIYLGTIVIVLATLHCGGQFHWNVHMVAYLLLCGVVGSGFVGLYFYLTSPRAIADAHAGSWRAAMFSELFDLDDEGRKLARNCEAAVGLAVKSAIERTVVGGGVLDQLMGTDRSLWQIADEQGGSLPKLARNIDQQPIIDLVSYRVPRVAKLPQADVLQTLVSLLCRRQALLRRIRRDIRLQGWLKIWLYVHVPLTIALLMALVAHILSTFVYW